MSKITQEKKALKGKQKKIADANAKKSEKSQPKQKKAIDGIKNIGCCCTCKNFPMKIKHETQPCKVAGKYVARKAKMPCYKCKFEA